MSFTSFVPGLRRYKRCDISIILSSFIVIVYFEEYPCIIKKQKQIKTNAIPGEGRGGNVDPCVLLFDYSLFTAKINTEVGPIEVNRTLQVSSKPIYLQPD